MLSEERIHKHVERRIQVSEHPVGVFIMKLKTRRHAHDRVGAGGRPQDDEEEDERRLDLDGLPPPQLLPADAAPAVHAGASDGPALPHDDPVGLEARRRGQHHT